ncbi:rhodanese-like domain-containing protein [Rubellicoccus peritrichatus]|uniref:DUF2892 domain-containing protein n=1 Tax=Rubellicoccus peritrichatus TaxID=3080537 RepID=A0AAQ3L8B9_9BACT|nr:rhodanese-like domain-containing protein [Puniceicoccus sp. CR14]WOO39517.1 DUF2892 domain-containing protein [Puniceicoccus sp. CR14]
MASLAPSVLNSHLLENSSQIYLVDVRTPAEHRAKHLPNSDLRPVDRFNEKEAKAVKAAAGDRKVCFICQSGKRSKLSLNVWKKAGFSDADELDGGLNAWEAEGLSLEKGQGEVMSIERQVRIAAGSLVFIGTLLGVFVSPWFLIIPGFIGAGLTFAGITDTCGMGMMLAKMPWNN